MYETPTGGVEVLRDAAHFNAAAEENEFWQLDVVLREGLRVQMWRALPDSPNAA